MMIKTIFAATILAVTLVSCNSSKTTVESVIPDVHTSQNSLDWAGAYSGSLPCAQCQVMETELILSSDNKYILTQRNYNREDEPEVTEGKFAWKENVIILENFPQDFETNTFKVEENKIRMLNKNGEIVIGDSENSYILSKNGNSEVENKKWKLIEINGKKVQGTVDSHYIVFHTADNRIEAYVGCNQLTFGYKIKKGLVLETTPGISTMMACQDGLEEEFKKMILEADNISVSRKTLTLNKGRMAPLAVFESVE